MSAEAFGCYRGERVAVFIDGANLYATTKALQFDIDYKKMLHVLRNNVELVTINYYTAMIEDQEYSSIRPLIDWLDYNGYQVRTKPVKEFTDAQGRRKIKGNMDVNIAVDMMALAQKGRIDHMILITGDGDFTPLVQEVQRNGVRVSVASTIKTQPPMIADDLRRSADRFLDIDNLISLIGRNPADRQERPDRPMRPSRFDGDSYADDQGRGGQEAPAFLQNGAQSHDDEGDDVAETGPESGGDTIAVRPKPPTGRSAAARSVGTLRPAGAR